MEDNATFTNHEISSHALPQIEQLNGQAISKKHRMANVGINIFLVVLFGILSFIVNHQSTAQSNVQETQDIALVLLVIAGFWTLKSIYQYFADKQKFYALREQDLSYMSGLIFKKTVTQPILRIQHIELKQGPIDRKLKLANIQAFSAGGATHTFEIPGLEIKKAEALRQFVLDHKDMNNHG